MTGEFCYQNTVFFTIRHIFLDDEEGCEAQCTQ